VEDLSILKIEAAGSSETFIPIYQPALLHVPEDLNVNIDCGENLKSLCYFFIFSAIFHYGFVAFTFSSIHLCPQGGRCEYICY
jgi:hypothetical protein